MVRAVLVTHGFQGAELVHTVEGILGPLDGVGVVSNSGTSLETLSDRVLDLLSDNEDPVLLFVDLLGGSCGHACQQIRTRHPLVVLLSGVNLPMLLEFFYNRDRVPLEDLIQRLIEKGKDGIQCLR
jgi:mannose/fructose-specific phosphotransferase system component IIA